MECKIASQPKSSFKAHKMRGCLFISKYLAMISFNCFSFAFLLGKLTADSSFSTAWGDKVEFLLQTNIRQKKRDRFKIAEHTTSQGIRGSWSSLKKSLRAPVSTWTSSTVSRTARLPWSICNRSLWTTLRFPDWRYTPSVVRYSGLRMSVFDSFENQIFQKNVESR